MYFLSLPTIGRPRGLMDMASDFGSEDCGFESHRGQSFSFFKIFLLARNPKLTVFYDILSELYKKDSLHILLYGFLDFIEHFDQRKYKLCSLTGEIQLKEKMSASLVVTHPFAPSKNIAGYEILLILKENIMIKKNVTEMVKKMTIVIFLSFNLYPENSFYIHRFSNGI